MSARLPWLLALSALAGLGARPADAAERVRSAVAARVTFAISYGIAERGALDISLGGPGKLVVMDYLRAAQKSAASNVR